MREEERLPIFILTVIAIVIIICLLAWRNSYKRNPDEHNNGFQYTNKMSNELDKYVDKIEK